MKRLLLLSWLFMGAGLSHAAERVHRTEANVAVEMAFQAERAYKDPFHEVAVDVLFTDPEGRCRKVPAFWAGGSTWKVRYASPRTGAHAFRAECNVSGDRGLHGVKGRVNIAPYRGANPLYLHGPLRVAADLRHFEHADGTPFFWLGDTWWMGLCHRLHWPEEFQRLAADRRAKGFTVVQIVAGLYPDMPAFDPRGANEAGFPWEPNYARIRPEYFDAADRRLAHLVDAGITPCIVGAWGYFLPWMGVDKAQQHWRYLIARYGAWPVVWCVAGEANLPYYLAKGFPFDDRQQVKGWTEVLRYVRATDPFRRPLTIHPTGLGRLSARGATDDESLLDFDMLQTGHGGREVLGPTLKTLRESLAAAAKMPVLNGEVSYEALLDRIPADVARLMFWSCMLSGAAGHTYGANGIWQCNRRGQAHGASPHGGSYGAIPWDEAMRLPGSRQLGLGKQFLERWTWQRFEPHPEWVEWDRADKPPALGRWIWHAEGDPRRDAPVARRFFRLALELPADAQVRRARLRIGGDDRFQAWINGRETCSGAGWSPPLVRRVDALLRPGRNVLAVEAENLAAPVTLNPAGLIMGVEIELANGAIVAVGSDARWRTAQQAPAGWQVVDFNDAAWTKAAELGNEGIPPWGTLAAGPAIAPTAAGIPGRVRVCYVPDPDPVLVRRLGPGAACRATVFDPVTGESSPSIRVTADASGTWRAPAPSHDHDWVLVVEPE